MSQTILLIEKDPAAKNVITMILKDDGYEVVVGDNTYGIEKILKLKPSLVLLHNGLNNFGVELCKAIKEHEQSKHISVIVMSLEAGVEPVARAYGANCFLQKPFDIDELSAQVKQLI